MCKEFLNEKPKFSDREISKMPLTHTLDFETMKRFYQNWSTTGIIIANVMCNQNRQHLTGSHSSPVHFIDTQITDEIDMIRRTEGKIEISLFIECCVQLQTEVHSLCFANIETMLRLLKYACK